MRVAVISDIHGNHHALEAVMDAIGRDPTDAIWCLGDLVGYGARPNECCATVAQAAAVCLVGNHDLGVTGRIDLADFSPDEAARAAIRLTSAPLVLVGHSHVAFAYSGDGRPLGESLAPGDTEIDLAEGRWLLNPGSVGQPRDGDPRAAYVTLDFDRNRALFHRVQYPVERTQEEILDAGLPETLAGRLAFGL